MLVAEMTKWVKSAIKETSPLAGSMWTATFPGGSEAPELGFFPILLDPF